MTLMKDHTLSVSHADIRDKEMREYVDEQVSSPREVDTFFYKPDEELPAYLNKRPGMDAGYDLYATKTTWLWPFQTKTIKSNIHVHVVAGHFGLVTSRGGHAGRGWLTHSGIVDHGYTGQVGVMQTNLSFFPRRVKRGERLAQLLFIPFTKANLTRFYDKQDFENKVQEQSGSNRGTQAYNSSGLY